MLIHERNHKQTIDFYLEFGEFYLFYLTTQVLSYILRYNYFIIILDSSRYQIIRNIPKMNLITYNKYEQNI